VQLSPAQQICEAPPHCAQLLLLLHASVGMLQ
jgi:hypothetical protein